MVLRKFHLSLLEQGQYYPAYNPGQLSATATAGTNAVLTWTAFSGASNYKLLEFQGTAPTDNYTVVYDGANLTYTVARTTGTYNYQVISEDANGNDLAYSNTIQVDFATGTVTNLDEVPTPQQKFHTRHKPTRWNR